MRTDFHAEAHRSSREFSARPLPTGIQLRQWATCHRCGQLNHQTFTLCEVEAGQRHYIGHCAGCGVIQRVDGPGAMLSPASGGAA